MSRGCTLSILGLYNYNTKLFSEMVFPSAFTDEQKKTVIENILIEGAELECAFPDWNVLKSMIGIWSKLNVPTWERIYNASLLEYNPIENYNRNESETIESNGTLNTNDSDRLQTSGTDSSNGSETHFGTDSTSQKITSYDSDKLKQHDESDLNHGHNIANSSSMTYGKADTRTRIMSNDSQQESTRKNITKGNIGVTTSQQMLEQEYLIAFKINVLPLIVKSFIERFCILVY